MNCNHIIGFVDPGCKKSLVDNHRQPVLLVHDDERETMAVVKHTESLALFQFCPTCGRRLIMSPAKQNKSRTEKSYVHNC